MKGIHVTSEIKPLKKVLLHRPGNELLNLTPDTLEELLFDDIPFLKIAQQEHDAFAKILRDNGVEVVYLENLVAEVFDLYPEVREQFLRQFLKEANITGDKYTKLIIEYLNENYPSNLELVLKTMEGMRLSELPKEEATTLIDRVENYDEVMLLDPLPNLYFQRDPFASVGNGVLLHKMYSKTRSRETIYDEYVFKYHPDFKDVPLYYSRNDVDHIEGGDVLNLNESTLAIGISQRTNPDAIERTAKRIFADENSLIRTIYAFHIPKSRAFMHLDTVFTQIDYDKFTIHPGIQGPLQVFEITKGDKLDELNIKEVNSKLEDILAKHIGVEKVTLIQCGGGDKVISDREQWNYGSNTLCIKPGEVIVYARNYVTNKILQEHGIITHIIPSSELSRGRGGPRCMSMPLEREV